MHSPKTVGSRKALPINTLLVTTHGLSLLSAALRTTAEVA